MISPHVMNLEARLDPLKHVLGRADFFWWVLESALAPHSSTLVYSIVRRSGTYSIHYPSEEITILTLPVFRPYIILHWDNVGNFQLHGLTVSKKSSNWMWNYGGTHLVCKFSIRAIDNACLGEGTRLISILALNSHLGCRPPDYRLLLRA